MDGPVVGQYRVGEAVDPVEVTVAVHDGRAALVGRRHDQRTRSERSEQQMVHRRIGHHDPDVAQAGRHEWTQCSGPRRHQHDRGGRPAQRPGSGGIHLGDAPGALDVGGHHREGFGGPTLPLTQRRHRCVVVGPAGEVVAADTLDRDDRSAAQRRGSRRHRRSPARTVPTQRRATVRAGDGLGVVAAVSGVGVFVGTRLTHREIRHRRGGPVVGQIGDDGIARTAVRARDEGMQVSAIAGVEQFPQAVGADGDIGRNQGARRRGGGVVAVSDRERRVALGRGGFDVDRVDARERRRCVAEPGQRRGHPLAGALELAVHRPGGIEHEARDPVVGGDAGDLGAEPHTLHQAGDAQPETHGVSDSGHTAGFRTCAHGRGSPQLCVSGLSTQIGPIKAIPRPGGQQSQSRRQVCAFPLTVDPAQAVVAGLPCGCARVVAVSCDRRSRDIACRGATGRGRPGAGGRAAAGGPGLAALLLEHRA